MGKLIFFLRGRLFFPINTTRNLYRIFFPTSAVKVVIHLADAPPPSPRPRYVIPVVLTFVLTFFKSFCFDVSFHCFSFLRSSRCTTLSTRTLTLPTSTSPTTTQTTQSLTSTHVSNSIATTNFVDNH